MLVLPWHGSRAVSFKRKPVSEWRRAVLATGASPRDDASFERPKSKPLPRRSAKREAVGEVRRELVASMLAKHARCQAGAVILGHLFTLDAGLAVGGGTWRAVRTGLTCAGEGAPQDVHELLRRSAGGSITDESNCIAVCRVCHEWIHANPAAARKLGLLKSRYP